MNIDNLIIEVTRKCNMTCAHCLRGTAQNKEIKKETISKFLLNNKIEYISTITFTGGEPSLNTQAIKDFILICKENNIEVGNFYIATNGKQENEEFLRACLDLYLFCSDNEMSQVQVSRSDFHNEQDENWIKKLSCLKFANERENINYEMVISEGKGKELNELNGTIDTARKIKPEPLTLEEDHIEGEIYLNVNGDICTSCDLSYIRQNKLKIGNVYEQSLIEMIKGQK